ncbi:MAG: PcfB family protein [Oscillospiraceae bacterium]|nr:PcfB family protein [Oscillospiraceae bacterium]
MSYSGEAADQVVRISLNGAEVAARLSGSAAKQVAILLYAVMKDQQKTKGKVRLSNMLRSGKELKVFAVRDKDLETFCKAAKEYGVLYCVLRDKDSKDGITDIMVKAEDAPKINRIYERFGLATVDMAQIKMEAAKEKTGEAKSDENPTLGRMEKSNPSEPTYKPKENPDKAGSEQGRSSVRQELRDIKAQQSQRKITEKVKAGHEAR